MVDDKIITISDDIYPVDEMFTDILKEIDNIKDILVVVFQKDKNAYILHTGISIEELAVSTKLIDYEIKEQIDEKVNSDAEEQ